MVFYRKYRPQKISELDLLQVREKLSTILKSQDIPHAFLFTGSKGLGKTSAARILAKAVNCEKKNNESRIKNQGEERKEKTHNSSFVIHDSDDIEPCNVCQACTSITDGSNIDVIEIDAASNRGIDEIRNLREKIKFSPVSLPKKVYIIDEVHMLTNEAFNALLKTLEEPPRHVIFIMCTTESWKLPDTIVSRTFIVEFNKANAEELKKSLARVAKGEKLIVEDKVFEQIYLLSEGSFRDATKILEELALVSKDKKINLDLLETTFKTQSIDNQVYKLISYMADKKAKESLEIIDQLSNLGIDFKIVIEKIVDVLRKLFLRKAGVSLDKQKISEDVKNIENIDTYSIKKMIEYFSSAYKDLKTAVLPQLPLELVIVNWCMIETQNAKLKTSSFTKVSEDKQNLEQDKQKEKSEILTNTQKDLKVNNEEKKIEGANIDIKKAKEEKDDEPQLNLARVGDKEYLEKNFLKLLIDKIKKENFSVAGFLRGCKLISINDNNIEFETSYKFHGERLRDLKVKKLLDKKASEILAKQVSVEVKIKNK